MNILIIVNDFKPLTGGVAEYTHQTAKFLSIRGNSVIVLSPHVEQDEEFDKTCSYKIYRYDTNALRSLFKLHRYLKEYGLLRDIIKKHRIEIVIGNHLCLDPYIYWLVAKILRIPYCVFVYGKELKVNMKSIDGFKRQLVLRCANKIFCISSFTADSLKEQGISFSKIIMAYPGFLINDFEIENNKLNSFFAERFGLKNKRVILTVGRLVERKGQDIVIKALPKILKEIPNLVYLIAGEGPYEGELKRLTEEYGVKEQVIFVGRITDNEKWFYYNSCDVFAMVNRELKNGDMEGFGIVFLEANACGKPVIGGKSGGAVDAIIHNQTGLLVDPNNIDEVTGAIIYLLKNPNIAESMGRKGRQMVEENFNWEKLIPKFESELKNLIK